MDTVQHPACLLGAQVHQRSVCVCIHLQNDETVIKEVMNHVQGEMGMENLTFEKPLPAGGSMAILAGPVLSAAPPSPKVPGTVSLVPQHSPPLLYSMQGTN